MSLEVGSRLEISRLLVNPSLAFSRLLKTTENPRNFKEDCSISHAGSPHIGIHNHVANVTSSTVTLSVTRGYPRPPSVTPSHSMYSRSITIQSLYSQPPPITPGYPRSLSEVTATQPLLVSSVDAQAIQVQNLRFRVIQIMV